MVGIRLVGVYKTGNKSNSFPFYGDKTIRFENLPKVEVASSNLVSRSK